MEEEPLARSRPQWPQPPRHFWQLSRFDQQKQILANDSSKFNKVPRHHRKQYHIQVGQTKITFAKISDKTLG